MKNSLTIISFFVLGILGGFYSVVPDVFIKTDYSVYALYALMIFVGIGLGANKKS